MSLRQSYTSLLTNSNNKKNGVTWLMDHYIRSCDHYFKQTFSEINDWNEFSKPASRSGKEEERLLGKENLLELIIKFLSKSVLKD